MKKISEYIIRETDSIKGREEIEWSNFWYDGANKDSHFRLLLIGDSTARMIRSELAKQINAPVDLLGTSSGLHDRLFLKQVDCFFDQSTYKYDAIFIQLGHHSRINDNGLPYSELDYEIFKDDYRHFIEYLRQYTDNIIAESIFYSVLPKQGSEFIKKVRKKLKVKEAYDDEVNSVKDMKNNCIRELCDEMGIPYLDINTYILRYPKKYVHYDHIHFEDSAKKVIVEEMIKYIPERG